MDTLKYTVRSTLTGKTYTGKLGVDIRKTLDRRSDSEPVQLVYECIDPVTRKTVRVWTDECAGVDAEFVSGPKAK